jgi:hypothetical protein
MKRSSEGGHWYLKDGSPFYEVLSAKGELRGATLADARKVGAVPSVTNVLSIISKPALTTYLQEQMLDAALLVKRDHRETEEEYRGRIWQAAELHATERREEGTKIHTLIEKGFVDGDQNIYYEGVMRTINELFPDRNWEAERSFASCWGFGGKADLSSTKSIDGINCKPIVIDFKTKEWSDGDKPRKYIYDDHAMQLSAYGFGLFNQSYQSNFTRVNLFVRPSDGECLSYIHKWDDGAMSKFLATLNLWKVLKNYDSEWEI